MPERIPALEADVKNLQRQVDDLTRRFEDNQKRQDARHQENSVALQEIKLTLQDFGTALKIGRYIMHALWGLAGTAAGALVMKWVATKS
jgi:DNA repair exonuclease SbcCD ATPase subunit